jgi:hypothetical protein
MPVEIKELVIRAVVSPAAAGPGAVPAGGGGGAVDTDAPAAERGQEAIVAAAVKEILRILRAAKER